MATLNREAVWDRLGYEPFTEQKLIHDSKARFKAPACGRRFGKSKSAAVEALTNPTWNLFMPDVRGWIVGPKYILGEKEFRYIWDFFMKKMKLGPKIKKKAYNVRTGDMFIELPWGARIDVMSAQHKDTLVGEGLHFLIVAEAAKQDSNTWQQYLRATLADYHGWAIFPSTPQGFNWYFTDVHQLGDKKSSKYNEEYESWNFPSWLNTHVYPGGETDPEIILLKETMPEDEFDQEIGASFRRRVGLIYPEFDEEIHVIEHYTYRPDWPTYMWFDFGFTNPFVALDVQVSPSDDVFIWRERYVAKMTVDKHAHELKARKSPRGYHIVCGFGDSADPAAVETLGEYLCPTIAMPEAKDWGRGIQEVKRFLKGEDRLPHLFIHKSCVETIREFSSYKIKPPSSDDTNLREAADPWSDHAMDAIRYGLMHLFVVGGARYSIADIVDVDEYLEPEERGIFTRQEDSIFTMGGSRRW